MALVVNTNLGAQMVANNLGRSQGDLTSSMQRLSSGLRINSAGDDAAGLSLSEKMKSQISASDIAKNNTLTGVNMLQTMDSDLGKMGDLLQRMRDLSVQSSNGVYSAAERTALNAENTQLITEIGRISTNSSFGGTALLSAATAVNLQVGTNASADNQISFSTILATAAALGVNANDIGTSAATANTALIACDAAIGTLAGWRATVGATINRLQGTIERTDARKVNMESATSTITDADVATESARFTRAQILKQTATSMLAQANQLPSLALKLIQ